MKILHLSDFHIKDPDDSNSFLRNSNYKPFLNSLFNKIVDEGIKEIDLIICTGDFVDKYDKLADEGKSDNCFRHAEIIINYISKKFKIDSTCIFTCIGNHDFSRNLDKEDRELDARREYNKFKLLYNQSEIIKNTESSILYYNEIKDIYIVSIDSTNYGKGNNLPGITPDKEIDAIFLSIQDNVPNNKRLIILSHYPMDVPRKTEIMHSDSDWVNNHFWKRGNHILHKLLLTRDQGATIYLYGDGHIPDFWMYNIENHHGVMTGMIGGNNNKLYTDKATGENKIYRNITQAMLIEINSDVEVVHNSFTFETAGYEDNNHQGIWSRVKELTSSRKTSVPSLSKKSIDENNEPEKQPIQIEERSIADNKTELISSSIQKIILDNIAKYNLYSFGKHITSNDSICLGWVDIDALLNDNLLFARSIEKCNEWLQKNSSIDLNEQNSVLLGMDFWGSCIATQISVVSNISNYIIATKGDGRYNIELEKLNTVFKLKLELKEIKNIILVSDVVSTGNSIEIVRNKIIEIAEKEDLKFISISVISDISQNRNVDLNNFERIGALCTELKIPVMEINKIPGSEILKPKIDLR